MPGTHGGPEPDDEGYGPSAFADEPYLPPPVKGPTNGGDAGPDRGQQWTNGAEQGAEGAEGAGTPEPDLGATVERVGDEYIVAFRAGPDDPPWMTITFRGFRPGEYRRTKAEVVVAYLSRETDRLVTFLDDVLLDDLASQERLGRRIEAATHVPGAARRNWAAHVRDADRMVREALEARAEGMQDDAAGDGGMVWLGGVTARPPQPLLLGMVDAGGAFTIANAHGGAGKGLTGCWLVRDALARGIVPAILDFEGRSEEWVTRMGSLGLDLERVAYISRDRLPLGLRGLSLLDPRLADHLLSEMQRMGVGFYLIDNIITALLVGEEEMKSDPQVPWRYRTAVEAWRIPGISFAHPARGSTTGDPFGSVMWQAASRFLWHGTAAAGAEQQEHHVRWRLHKANTKRKAEPFLLVTTFTDDLPVAIESRLDSVSTRDWLMSVMGVREWSVEDLVDLMLEGEDDPSPVKREQAKERIGRALRRERDSAFEIVGQSRRGAWARWRIKTSGWAVP